MADKVDYEVTQTREIAGQWRTAGETVTLSERAAKYYRAPYGSGLMLSNPMPKRVKGAGSDPAGNADA